MPKCTKVHDMVEAMVAKGMEKSRAIKIAQAKTGQSYKSGKKSKGRYGYRYKSKR